jgi:hypothetical protein
LRLPHVDRAIIAREKIAEYLLSPDHPGSKAGFFTRLGWHREQWEAFAAGLIEHARTNEVTAQQRTAFGMRYIVEGPLRGPDGRLPQVRTVWVIESEEQVPRLITAYPCEVRYD